MTKHLVTVAAQLLATGSLFAAPMVTLPVSGWNQDIVIGAGEDLSGRTETMDGNNAENTWYGVGFNAGAPATGLPEGPTESQTSASDLTFTLQPFDANNALYNGGMLTLATPSPLIRFALIGSTGNGNADISVTVTFADASSETFGPGLGENSVNGDWFARSSVAYTASGRVEVNSGSFNAVGSDNPRLYESAFTLANNVKNVVSLTITDGGGGNNAIMAVSAEAVPEPTAIMAVLGGAAFLGMMRKRRTNPRA